MPRRSIARPQLGEEIFPVSLGESTGVDPAFILRIALWGVWLYPRATRANLPRSYIGHYYPRSGRLRIDRESPSLTIVSFNPKRRRLQLLVPMDEAQMVVTGSPE